MSMGICTIIHWFLPNSKLQRQNILDMVMKRDDDEQHTKHTTTYDRQTENEEHAEI